MQVPMEEILASVLSGCRVSCLLAGKNNASTCGRTEEAVGILCWP